MMSAKFHKSLRQKLEKLWSKFSSNNILHQGCPTFSDRASPWKGIFWWWRPDLNFSLSWRATTSVFFFKLLHFKLLWIITQ